MRPSAALGTLAVVPAVLATASSKRGLVYVPNPKHPTDDNVWDRAGSDLTWYYNYGVTPTSAYLQSDLQFVPMLWGATEGATDTDFSDSVKAQIAGGANISYVLGFNEPDNVSNGGSGIPADLAASTWIREIEPLRKLGIKLCAPATTGAPSGFTWLENFFKECNGGCNPTCMPVHWYGNFAGMASHIGQKMAAYPNMTIWVTEYALADDDLADTQAFANESMQYFDRMANITHYSYFGSFRSSVSNVGPNVAMLDQGGGLTDIGSWYLGGNATGKLPTSSAARPAVLAGWSLAVFTIGFWLTL